MHVPREGFFMPCVGIPCQNTDYRYIFPECSVSCSRPVRIKDGLWISLGRIFRPVETSEPRADSKRSAATAAGRGFGLVLRLDARATVVHVGVARRDAEFGERLGGLRSLLIR